MNNINWKFTDKFRSHWVKVRFYREKPKDNVKKTKNMRFCEAVKKAVTAPVLLSKDNVSCMGAQYAFGWNMDTKKLLRHCRDKTQTAMAGLKSIFSQSPRLKQTFKYIGLNTEGAPDVLISYTSPQEVMYLINSYQKYTGKNPDVSLSSMMPVCGGIAAGSYLDGKFTVSFGCEDSRNFASLGRSSVAVGIPRNLYSVFVD